MARGFRLDIDIFFDRTLVHGDDLDTFQALLVTHAPTWVQGLKLWLPYEAKVPIDVTVPTALAQTIRAPAVATAERHMQYWQSREPPAYAPYFRADRVKGTEELRGASLQLILVISIDDFVQQPIGNVWLWGNSLTIQVCQARVEGIPASKWAHDTFIARCAALDPAYARAHMSDEFEAKNISHEGGGSRAVGVDVSALPGLYWLNFFGREYRGLIGRDALLTAPAFESGELRDGVMLGLAEDARAWSTPEYRQRERAVLEHLGRHYFFDRDYPDRLAITPAFEGLRPPTRVDV